ncbi:MarR family winged helix-turn-helix transcriptional regulator [Actinocatenispora thailandica]|nr:MarR family transcriptional regulator [Actinocatenispora thailandica]
MTDVKAAPLLGTSAFRLGVVGAVVTERFAAEIAAHDLKPKHVGVLALLGSAPATSQLDLARVMGVAPSLIVRIADHLERLGAVERVRDPVDRRRQALRLTAHGSALLAECTRASREMEDELLAGLSAPDRAAFRTALAQVATNLGLPS